MRERTKLLILISIVIPASILLTYLESSILSIDYNINLFIINICMGFLFLVSLRIQKYLTSLHITKLIYKPTRTLKIGLDLHCCIDNDPQFFGELSRTLIALNHEVHITTGSLITPEIIEELHSYGMEWTHLWSISNHYKNKPGIELWYDDKGRPWVDENLWNMAKGDYAKSNNLDLCIDDTEVYGKYFSTSFAHCNIINKFGKKRKPKAIMPPKPSLIKTENV